MIKFVIKKYMYQFKWLPVYIKYRSISTKDEAEECKKLADNLFILNQLKTKCEYFDFTTQMTVVL